MASYKAHIVRQGDHLEKLTYAMGFDADELLREVKPVGASPKKHTPRDNTLLGTLKVGNPYVEMEPVSGSPPVLQIRKRYR